MFQTVAQRSEDHVFHVWKGRCGPRDPTVVCFLKPDSSVYLRIRLLQPRCVDVTVSIKTFLLILEPIRSGLRGAQLDDTDGDQIYCVLRESAHLRPNVRASPLELRELSLGEVSESLNPGLPCQQQEQCSLLGLRGQVITRMMMAGHRGVAATYIFPFCWRFKWLRHKQVLLSLDPTPWSRQ